MRLWRYSPGEFSQNIAAAAGRYGDPERRFEVAARNGNGEIGRLVVADRHLFFAQRGSGRPAAITVGGLLLVLSGFVARGNGLSYRYAVGISLVGLLLLLGGGSWLVSFLLRRGVMAIPAASVSPALVGGRVWARYRGSLYEFEPLHGSAGDLEEAIARWPDRSGAAGTNDGGDGRAAAEEGEEAEEEEDREARLVSLLLKIGSAIVLAGAVIGLATVIRPSLFFSTTLPAGGDMGSHHYIPQQLGGFLPFRLSGWSDGWYAGFPMLHFYFPLPYVAIVLLQKVVGYGFAFRMVSLAGVAGFPFACYYCLRWMGLPQPVPMFGAAGGFVYVVSETFSILGGNIASTMAGEFPFSISLTLSVFLIGLLWRGSRTGKGLAAAAVVAAAMVLCHVVPLLMVVPAVLAMVPGRLRRLSRQAGFLGAAGVLGVLLAAVWLVPFYARVEYTAHAVWTRDWKSTYLTGGPVCTGGCHQSWTLAIFLVAGLLGLGVAVIRGDGPPFVFASTAVVMAVLGWKLPEGSVLNTRVLPFYYTMVVLAGAYGIGIILRLAVVDLGRSAPVLPALAVVLCGIVIVGANSEIKFIRGWSAYNYSGYEAKSGKTQYQDLMNTLRTLPDGGNGDPGRILWEYNGDYEKFGTTRSLELISYWTGKPSMEGLLVESSITSPFHFIMQNETSFTGTGAVPGLRYPSFDFARGLLHARLFDITWYVAFTQTTKDAARKAGYQPFATSGQFEIFQLNHPGIVSVPDTEPIVAGGRDWYAGGLDWFCFSPIDRLVVFPQSGEGPALSKLPHLAAPPPSISNQNNGFQGKNCGRGDHELNLDLIQMPAGNKLPKATVKVTRASDGRIEFDTDQVGVPHLVSVSWFPTWKAEGAEGPYLVSPSLMMVIPTSGHVVLTEGRRGLDWLALLLTLIGVGLAVTAAVVQRRRGLFFAPLPEPMPVWSMPEDGLVEQREREGRDAEGPQPWFGGPLLRPPPADEGAPPALPPPGPVPPRVDPGEDRPEDRVDGGEDRANGGEDRASGGDDDRPPSPPFE